MKSLLFITKAKSLLFLLVFVWGSCNKDDAAPPPPAGSETIGAQVATGSDFTLLKAAAVRADLVATSVGLRMST